jgi:AcrR family transcriptional regulator
MEVASTPVPAARDRILDAAEQLVADAGASNLTLDAVAAAAGVSKGGLLYHYPSKDALLTAMIERHCDDIDRRCLAELGQLPADQGSSQLKASILGVLKSPNPRDDLGAAILAAAANNPRLLDGVRRRYADHIAHISAPKTCFARAAVIMLAVDGLMFGEIWQLTPFDAEQREKIVQELLRLADEACPVAAEGPPVASME